MKRLPIYPLLYVLVSFSVILPFSRPLCQELGYLEEGISHYRQENYEEAIEVLKKAREEDPNSSTAAYFLGMAYKQVIDYPKAFTHLRDAVALSPRIKEAVVELIDVSIHLGTIQEAKKWIEVAERETIFPAKVSFLKGSVLQGEGKNLEAIESFKKAGSLDKALAQSAEFNMALCYVREGSLAKAKELFQAAVLHDPYSDLASFARQYQDRVEQRIFLERPLHLTVGLYGQYDTNVVLKPTESTAAADITDEQSGAMLSTITLDYVALPRAPWLFNARYCFHSNLYQEHSDTHNVIGNSIYVSPGFRSGRFALNLAGTYAHFLVGHPSYEQYMEYLCAGPLLRLLPNQNHILELFPGYSRKEYFQSPTVPEEDRDSVGPNMYISWILLLRDGGFFNLKYGFIEEDTEGANWENKGNKFTITTAIPLRAKLGLQLSGEVLLQDFQHDHSVFNKKREDDTYTGCVGWSWEISKSIDLIAQYTRTRCESNIAVYDYKRSLYTAGIELRF